MGLTLFLELQDTSFRSERDVELALRLPVLAMVPAIDAESATRPAASSKDQPGSLQLEMGARS